MLVAGALIIFAPEHAHYLVLLISLVLIISGYTGLLPYKKAKKWLRDTAVIDSITETHDLIQYGGSSTPFYYPEVEYSYLYNGTRYTNSCVTFEKQNIWTCGYNNWGDELPEEDKAWYAWSQGNNAEVYINPKSPQQSVLFPFITKKRRSHHMAVIVSGILIFVAWLLLKYYNIT